MSIVRKIRTSSSRTRASSRGYRELYRAMASAPTRASREELQQLANMGR